MPERIDLLEPNPFISSPGDYLCHTVAAHIGQVEQWRRIFGEFIDGYMRMDYSERNLPALRLYNEKGEMEHDNWFIVGNITADLILPANLRREKLETVPDILTGALIQQFRRQQFFNAVRAEVPGLNWLGERIAFDKGLAFTFGTEGGTVVPMAQATINFRIDLRQWDVFLEQNDRTVDDPFVRTLKDLDLVATTIRGLNDDGTQGSPDVLANVTT